MTERRLFVMRHGERCDFVMGRHSSFMKTAFDSQGRYTPFDINLPRVLPKRADGWQAFALDTPLTEIGYLEAKLTGRAYKDRKVKIDYIYCSPALRCVQTAVGFVKGMGSDIKIRLEDGLFEWMYWCPTGRPSWMKASEFKKQGYAVEDDNMPIVSATELNVGEDIETYYRRTERTVAEILRRHPNGNILLVGHSGSPEACTRALLRGKPRPVDEFFHILLQTSYIANVELIEINGKWYHNGRPIPPLTVSAVPPYNPNILLLTDDEVRDEIQKKKALEDRK